MHILHVTPYYAPAYSFGGVVRMVEGVAQAQLAQGHRVTVLTTNALSLKQAYTGDLDTVQDGVRVIRCPNLIYPLRAYNLDTPFSMSKQAKALMPDIDIVHLHEFRTVENLLVTPIAKTYHKPVILSPHGTLTYNTGRSLLKSVWDKILSPRITPHIQHIVTLAQAELEDAQATWGQFSSQPEFSIVPNGVSLDDFSALPDRAIFREEYNLGDARIILFMGRLHQRKGVDILARAFKQANIPNTKLVIAGPDEGMLSTLEALADESFILTGFLSGEARLQALASADVFVLPAIGEGLSMAVLEAMAIGLPVVLSHGCNFPEVATADAGYIVNVNEADIANALENILADADRLAQMSDNAQALIRQKFTWEIVASQMTNVYSKYFNTP
ncbi:MAG: glycosyltransferase [Phototrophicaceae bacterium]